MKKVEREIDGRKSYLLHVSAFNAWNIGIIGLKNNIIAALRQPQRGKMQKRRAKPWNMKRP